MGFAAASKLHRGAMLIAACSSTEPSAKATLDAPAYFPFNALMQRLLLPSLLASALAIAPARASFPAQMPLQPADVFALQNVSDVQISPDARTVAYVRETPNIMTDQFNDDIWLVDVAGGGQRRLASSAQAPRWSPNGNTIAYVAADGAGRERVFLCAADGKTSPKALTDGTASPSGVVWNQDGSAIAYTGFVRAAAANLPMPPKPAGASWAPAPRVITAANYQADGVGFLPAGHTGLFVISTSTGETRPMRTGSLDVKGPPSWAPDGSSLVFSAHPTEGPAAPEKDALYRVTISSGQMRQLSSGLGLDEGAVVSPDGGTIAYVHVSLANPEHVSAWAMRTDGSDPHPLLTSLGRDVAQVGWARDGNLFVSYEDRGAGAIARVTSDHQAVKLATSGDGDSFSLANNGSIGFSLGTPDRPTAAAISDRGGQRALTHLNDKLLQTRTLAAFSPFDTKSSYDGEEVPGFIIKPPFYRQGQHCPTILWIHGGPYGDDGPQWNTSFQLLAAAGFVVLDTNPRGSRSFGFAYTDKLPIDEPGHAYDDVMSAVDAAVIQGIADPARLYVDGESYGGAMTSWIVGRTKRFRAAVAAKPYVLADAFLGNDQYEYLPDDPRGLPWEHPDAWWRSSPLSLVGHVVTPTLVLVGENDRRTPMTEAETFYNALRLRDVPSALLIYPETSHETLGRRPSQLASIVAATLGWFNRYR